MKRKLPSGISYYFKIFPEDNNVMVGASKQSSLSPSPSLSLSLSLSLFTQKFARLAHHCFSGKNVSLNKMISLVLTILSSIINAWKGPKYYSVLLWMFKIRMFMEVGRMFSYMNISHKGGAKVCLKKPSHIYIFFIHCFKIMHSVYPTI